MAKKKRCRRLDRLLTIFIVLRYNELGGVCSVCRVLGDVGKYLPVYRECLFHSNLRDLLEGSSEFSFMANLRHFFNYFFFNGARSDYVKRRRGDGAEVQVHRVDGGTGLSHIDGQGAEKMSRLWTQSINWPRTVHP